MTMGDNMLPTLFFLFSEISQTFLSLSLPSYIINKLET